MHYSLKILDVMGASSPFQKVFGDGIGWHRWLSLGWGTLSHSQVVNEAPGPPTEMAKIVLKLSPPSASDEQHQAIQAGDLQHLDH